MAETYEKAKRIENAINRLQPLVESGQASDAEKRALQTLQAQLPAAQSEIGKTEATYRGATRGVTAGLKDEIAGVSGFVQGDGYNKSREESIALDQAAKQAYPSEFNKGEFAGGGTLALGTLGLGGPALTGASMATKIGAGMLGGGAIGAGQGQSDYEMAGRPEGQRLDYYAAPTLTGAVTGGASYPLGKMVGAGVRGLRNMRAPVPQGLGRKPLNTLTTSAERTAQSGLDIKDYLGDLTPDAMLADVPGPMQQNAQGLAAMRGAGGSQLAKAVEDRAKSAGERIEGEMNTQIGAPNAAFNEQRRLASERTSKWGPEYEAALASEGALEVRPILNEMKEAQRVAGPDTARVLNTFIADLERKAENGLIDPAQMHWLRSDLNDALQNLDGPSKSNALLTKARDSMDEVLDTIPGYKDARTGYANNRAMERAIEEGEGALRGGRVSASSPEEFAERFDQFSDAQKEAFRTGLRRDIAALMGTSKNDAASAWGEFAKNWNEEKLRIALGDEAADPIIKRLRSEQVFSQTRGKVTQGTRTAETQEARDALGDYRDPETMKRPGPIARAKGAVDDRVNNIVDSLLYGNRQSDRNRQLGQMLSAQGPERDAILQAITQNLVQRQLPSRAADTLDPIIRSLIAGGGGAFSASQN